MTSVTAVREVYYPDIDPTPVIDSDPISALFPLVRDHAILEGHGCTFGGVQLPNNWLLTDDRPMFLALSFGAVRHILSDEECFSAAQGYGPSLGTTLGKLLFTMDEPEHGRYRGLVAKAFMHRSVTEQWLERHVATTIDEQLTAIEKRGGGDLVQDFTLIFPYRVIARITGVPDDCDEELSQYTFDSLLLGANPEAALRALDGMNRIFMQVIADNRRNPRDNYTTALINSEIDGDRLSDEDIAAFLRNLIAAGLDTTYRATGNLIFQLLEDPDQFGALRANPDLLDTAIWESLRMIPPGSFSPRVAKIDTEVEGVTIPKGSQVLACHLTANYDPRIWNDPLRFDITRGRKPTMTFGAGVHTCLGNNLARTEMRIAMEGVLQRLRNLRPDPERWPTSRIRGFGLRSPNRLPVLWDPAS